LLIEPVCGMPKRKSENGEQRLAPEDAGPKIQKFSPIMSNPT